MHVLIVHGGKIPALQYGGTERVLHDLGRALVNLGHRATFLVGRGSHCAFAPVIALDPEASLQSQIPADVDVVHLNNTADPVIDKPYLVTLHGNVNDPGHRFDQNTVFVSANHAERAGSTCFVHNGLDWDGYRGWNATPRQDFFHFLGKAAWRIKNVRGAIQVCQDARVPLKVMGGHRFNLKMGLRLTLDPRVSFEGMVDDARKKELLPRSRGLVFPVLWHEPFGVAITESLYFGAPVFGTPYGSLPELVTSEVGFLSSSAKQLARAVLEAGAYSRKTCSEYAATLFNAEVMARKYLVHYETVLNGKPLNPRRPRLVRVQAEKFLPWTD